MNGPAEIDVQLSKIDVPEMCRPKINSEIEPVGSKDAAPAGDRLSDSEEIQESRLRGGLQANTVRNVAFFGRKKGQQSMWLYTYVAGLAEHTMHDPAEMMGRNLNADRKGVDMHDRHSIAR